MRNLRLPLAMVLAGFSLFVAAPAEAAPTLLFAYETEDPAAGAGCKRRTEVWHDTTRVPPVWSRGYVYCS